MKQVNRMTTAPTSEEPIFLPPTGFLYSSKSIAAAYGMTPGQMKPLIDVGLVPVFKLPGQNSLCAFQSEIDARLLECWRRWRSVHPIPELADVVASIKKRKQKASALRPLPGAQKL